LFFIFHKYIKIINKYTNHHPEILYISETVLVIEFLNIVIYPDGQVLKFGACNL